MKNYEIVLKEKSSQRTTETSMSSYGLPYGTIHPQFGGIITNVGKLSDNTYFYVENGLWKGFVVADANGTRTVYIGVPETETVDPTMYFVNKIVLEDDADLDYAVSHVHSRNAEYNQYHKDYCAHIEFPLVCIGETKKGIFTVGKDYICNFFLGQDEECPEFAVKDDNQNIQVFNVGDQGWYYHIPNIYPHYTDSEIMSSLKEILYDFKNSIKKEKGVKYHNV